MGLAREYVEITGVVASSVEIAANIGIGVVPYLATAFQPLWGPKAFLYVCLAATIVQYGPLLVITSCFVKLERFEGEHLQEEEEDDDVECGGDLKRELLRPSNDIESQAAPGSYLLSGSSSLGTRAKDDLGVSLLSSELDGSPGLEPSGVRF